MDSSPDILAPNSEDNSEFSPEDDSEFSPTSQAPSVSTQPLKRGRRNILSQLDKAAQKERRERMRKDPANEIPKWMIDDGIYKPLTPSSASSCSNSSSTRLEDSDSTPLSRYSLSGSASDVSTSNSGTVISDIGI